jgi:glucoamylase
MEVADFLETYADWIEANLDAWTTTDDGVLLPGVKRHYMRIRPPSTTDPFHNPQIKEGYIHMANRAPDEVYAFEAREVIDGGFLELVRYGIRRADDPLVVDSVKVVDHVLKIETPYGPCWRRYNHDGYGQRKDGGPYEHWGQGRAWPLLGGERAHYELAAGHDVTPFIKAFEGFSSVGGMLPEQVWDHADLPSEGMYFGKSAGSAQPLVWAHSEYLKLLRSVVDGRIFDRVSSVEERYGKPAAERTVKNRIEVYQVSRPVSVMVAGLTLRIMDARPFRVTYTLDGWATTHHANSRPVGYPGSYADLETGPEQTGSLIFTLFWPGEERWLGHNVEVAITGS